MNRKLLVLTALALAPLGAAQGATLCVKSTGGGGCFTTIQAAVDAAAPGDRILIQPHASPKGYTENVAIATANLSLAGTGRPAGEPRCPKAILSACETGAFPTSCGGAGFEITAAGVTIKNLTLRHADTAVLIQPGGSNATIDRICSIENDDGVVTAAVVNNVRVLGSQFLGNHRNNAIDIDGDGTEVKDNRLLNTDAIRIFGARARVTGNTVSLTEDDDCIEVEGDDAVIQKNTLEACDGAGIRYFGDIGELSHNRIRLIPDDNEGIFAGGDNIGIYHNRIADISEEGIDVFDFTNGTIAHNTIERAGNDEDEGGIAVEGDNNLVEHNTTGNNSFAGIEHQNGNNNIYRANRSTGNGKSGLRIGVFDTSDGNVLERNLALNNQGEGINNDDTATNTVATGNLAQGNRTDVCNDGTFATFTGNIFTTGGVATPCVVEQ